MTEKEIQSYKQLAQQSNRERRRQEQDDVITRLMGKTSMEIEPEQKDSSTLELPQRRIPRK